MWRYRDCPPYWCRGRHGSMVSIVGSSGRFIHDGFEVWRQRLTPVQFTELCEQVEHYRSRVEADGLPTVMDEPKNKATRKSMNAMNQHEPWFQDVLDQLSLRQLAERLIQQPVVVRNVQWFDKPPTARSAPGTPPHQDAIFSALEPAEGLTFWLPLSPVDADNGCLRFLPESHGSILEHDTSDTAGFSRRVTVWNEQLVAREIAVTAQPRDLIAHHILTVHRTDPNRSDRHRPAVGIQIKSTRARETNPRAFRP